jgi:bilirubin oxidase
MKSAEKAFRLSAWPISCLLPAIVLLCFSSVTQANTPFNDLLIPPLIDSKHSNTPIHIEIRNGQHEFQTGIKSATKGYNGNYLGPTIRNYRNQPTRIQFSNKLEEMTTVHGHGLHVPGSIDGGPQNKIPSNATLDVTYPNQQQASTNWYHPHIMGSTARQVHAGLAGFFLIEDENSLTLGLPNTYGVDDIPLAVQDRTFVEGRMQPYPKIMPHDLREPTLIINGTLNPRVKVPRSLVRFRLLNASNARSYEFNLSNDATFYKIATEGGLLEAPVAIQSLKMSPGERNEIVLDMSDGQTVELIAKLLPKKYHSIFAVLIPFSKKVSMLRVEVDETLPRRTATLPKTLNTIHFYQPDEATVHRHFDIGEMDINGQQMDMSVINFRVEKDILELWTIDGGRHPFHMHGTSFQILSRNGKPPEPEERGWKDVVYPNGEVSILLKFQHEATEEFPYMYHCHILEHEDMGMMGQFTVE